MSTCILSAAPAQRAVHYCSELLGLLESTAVAGHPQAFFRSPDEPLWVDRWQIRRTAEGGFNYADYVQTALAAGRADNGCSARSSSA
ncbi:Stf0 family sulfotransferase [Micromonospora sp. NPDC005173]|uniref:Stf0 family sulfotransferase n=1 Tax=Micromonospora sp. NPDC005173 TaxID=3157165 RepID=UPI0033A4618E